MINIKFALYRSFYHGSYEDICRISIGCSPSCHEGYATPRIYHSQGRMFKIKIIISFRQFEIQYAGKRRFG